MNIRLVVLRCIPAAVLSTSCFAHTLPASNRSLHHPDWPAPATTALMPHNVTAAEKSVVPPGGQQSLNPQPLPPKWGASAGTLNAVNAGDAVSLNPQPLPPKIGNINAVNAGDAVSLNPQPLPPKVGSAAQTPKL